MKPFQVMLVFITKSHIVIMPFLCISSFCKCTSTKAKMHIYGRELPYMHILAFVNAHILMERYANMEEIFHIYVFFLLYMCIYRRKNAHIRKLASVNAHLAFCICAFTEEIFHNCAFSPSVNAHIQKARCAFTKESFRICAFCLP